MGSGLCAVLLGILAILLSHSLPSFHILLHFRNITLHFVVLIVTEKPDKMQ